MYRIAAACFVAAIACAFALLSATTPDTAVAQMQATADGASLERKARNALQAFVSVSPETLWAELAPWQQNSARLHKARLTRSMDAGSLEWGSIKAEIERKDPGDKLSLKSKTEFNAMKDAEFFGLLCGVYQLANDEQASSALGEEWFTTLRTVGFGMAGGLDQWDYLQQSQGVVRFETIPGAKVYVYCVAESKDWFVTRIAWQLGELKGNTTQAMSDSGLFLEFVTTASIEEQMAEAELIAGSLKNQARIAFAKNGQAPVTLTGSMNEGGSGAETEELDGQFYKIRSNLRTTDKIGIIRADSKHVKGKCMLLAFSWAGGDGVILHFNTQAELEERMEKIIAANDLEATDESSSNKSNK